MLSRSLSRPRHKNSGRPAEKSCRGFLQYVRGRACLVANAGCTDRIEAAHVDHAGGKGIGTKVADRYAIPLCDACHRRQHAKGWRSFEQELPGKDAVALADTYWRLWPGRVAWERKLSNG